MGVDRKTAQESRAEAFADGFARCVEMMRHEWRSRLDIRNPQAPVVADLWPILERMERRFGLHDDDLKAIQIPRLFGSDYRRLRYRVRLVEPHPHAGLHGFVLWSEAFRHEGGGFMVELLRPTRHGIVRVVASRNHWAWVDVPPRDAWESPPDPRDGEVTDG